jgi:hypothetical protein
MVALEIQSEILPLRTQARLLWPSPRLPPEAAYELVLIGNERSDYTFNQGCRT